MKPYTILSIIGAAALLVGCDTVGQSPKPPTPTEAKLYQVETNFVPITITKTNFVQSTNVVTLTNTVDNTVTTTNVVTVTPTVTQVQTNQAVYTYHDNPAITGTISALGTASGPFTAGVGTLVAGGLAFLYGLWGHLRSTKMGNTAQTVTDELEALRNFILTLPQGSKIDAAVTGWMQQHQVEAGVSQQVLKLIQGNTSDPTINGISASLQAAIDELTKPTVPTPPKV